MGRIGTDSASRHRIAMVLIAFALSIRALIPAGYMLAPAEVGWPSLVPCDDGVAAAPRAVHNHHRSGERDQTPTDRACPFAVASIPALPSPPPVPAPPMPPLAATPTLVPHLPALPFQAAALRPPATGPPAAL